MKDPDIVAVRGLPPAMADITEDSVGRTWRKVVNARREEVRRPVVRRWLVPIAAAVAVGALVSATALWLSGGTGTRLPSAGSHTIDTNRALARLIAASSQAGPAQVPAADQVIHVHSDNWTGTGVGLEPRAETEHQIYDIWFDPRGMFPVQSADGTASMMEGGRKHAIFVPDRTADLDPSFYQATPEWVASLPTDPAALYAVLQETVTPVAHQPRDHEIWSMMSRFYGTGDLLLSPQLRAALFRAYSNLGLSAETMMIGSETFIGLRHDANRSAVEVLFDPATGKAVGTRWITPMDVISPSPPHLISGSPVWPEPSDLISPSPVEPRATEQPIDPVGPSPEEPRATEQPIDSVSPSPEEPQPTEESNPTPWQPPTGDYVTYSLFVQELVAKTSVP